MLQSCYKLPILPVFKCKKDNDIIIANHPDVLAIQAFGDNISRIPLFIHNLTSYYYRPIAAKIQGAQRVGQQQQKTQMP